MENKSIIVIGAGISGLAAVYYMKKQLPQARVTLLEASDRIGGKIKTVHRDGFVIECGPEGYMARKPTLTNLIKDIGLGDHLVHSGTGTYYIYVNHRLRKMPEGSVMGIPTRMLPMVTTGLISPLGKLRAALDLLIPRVYHDQDLSLKEFFERRLGSELITNMIEPLLSGIYNGSLSDMSLEATLPQFAAIEKKHRSLILGMKSIQPPKQAGASKKAEGRFLSLSCGLDVLTEKLASYADEIRLKTPVEHVEPGKVTLDDGTFLKADSIILATSPKQLGPLLDFPEAWNLSNDKRTTTATVAFAFKKDEVESLDGTGYVVSRKEGLHITACSFMNYKWPYTAPENYTLIRTYVGTAEDAAVVEESDEEIEKKALTDLRKVGKVGTPLFSVITRQIDNMPQYTVNHNQRVQAFEQALGKIRGVYACGAMFHGVGLPDCVDNAMHVAEEAADEMKESEKAATNL
ncbi:protoporphyrinogen oxidase [Sporolactobacillus pectinivorans]|uniref:protoporphyrinogen oxidase n=1 Tax=Sporolactobacillus pectinivorans TaxID=1591408 RepID=UPI000C25C548|nr:protoporphyrinogen oxidase [Sporolactobacillus pectinivorans]